MKTAISVTLASLLVSACAGDPNPPPLRSLRGAGDSALLCLASKNQADEPKVLAPRPLESCPDYHSDDGELRELHALVTQTETGEVALVNLQTATVVDAERALPGISFVPVGAEPVSIASTPGAVASFVGVRESGREGIYGLPTSCVGPRTEQQPFVDIASWPACRLPAAPGAIQIIVDPLVDHDGDPSTPAAARVACSSSRSLSAVASGASPGATRDECPADLAREVNLPGRRKLLVAVPSLGQLLLLDAQSLLDREPGSFANCEPERVYDLNVALPESHTPAVLPGNMSLDASCSLSEFEPSPAADYRPEPVDMALAGERLYVADQGAPVIHVLDISDPCAIDELDPLLPTSFNEPSATVTTRRVAVSPLTSKRQRFVYAIDNSATLTAGSVMAFDVSDGATQRTPIVRERSELIVQEPPDRIQFAQEATDVEFVENRAPVVDELTGVALDNVACDPGGRSSAPGAQYRPSSDLKDGAAPSNLRGTFAFVALASGQLAVVDVEDLDAPCRRPTLVNTSDTEDFRGCVGDPSANYASPQTVSDEISCRVIEPHRARSSTFFLNDVRFGSAASLRQFPRLTSGNGRLLPTDLSDEGKRNPILLGVDFSSSERGQVFVGTTLFERSLRAENELIIDPARAENSSLALSFAEPRQFYPNEEFSLTFEGEFGDDVFSRIERDGSAKRMTIQDGVNGKFCSQGVQDFDATAAFATRFLPDASARELTEFAASHADYAQISGDFPEEDSKYWDSSAGRSCGEQLGSSDDEIQSLSGRRFCELWFGSSEVPTTRRDLRIAEAYQNRLSVEPRRGDEDPAVLLDLVACCFPEPTTYRVRAGQQWVVVGNQSGFQHHMTVDQGSGRCVEDCNPFVQHKNGRVLEISCRGECTDENGAAIVGLARDAGDEGRDQACVIAEARGGTGPGKPGEECIFSGSASRFAVYRGREASTRDMKFRWQLRGGFTPLTVNLSRSSSSVPERLHFIPGLQGVLVVDAGTAGLGLVSLTDLQKTTIN